MSPASRSWFLCASVLVACGNGAAPDAPDASTSTSDAPAFDPQGTYRVRLATSLGNIDLALTAADAPKAVMNFVTHTNDGYYTGMVFHRVIDDFMIQGGDPTGTGTGGASIYGADFEDEFNDLGMARGILAMANSGPDTNGSQFFIVQAAGGANHLIGKHTAFGKVTLGLEVLDAIAGTPTDGNDRPITPVTFTAQPLP